MKKSKTTIIALCVAAYMVSYLCRTNLSVAMDALMEEISLSRSQAGFIGTLYFWTYAGGQLLAGWLCTLIDPKKVVSTGLVLTAACNLFIGFSGAYAAVLILWMLNGLALALFWPPILQIATNWTTEQEYTRISVLLNLPTTVGFLPVCSTVGLLLTGWLVKKFAQRQQQAMLALLGLGTVAGCLMVLVQKNFMAVALCMGVLLAVVYGVNTILTTLLPLQFARTGNSGAMSSVVNFLSYLGAALGGIAAGTVSELWNWSAVYFMWAVLAGGGFVLLFLYGVLREISFKGIFTK